MGIDQDPRRSKHPFDRSQEGLKKLILGNDNPLEKPEPLETMTEGFEGIFWDWANKQPRPDAKIAQWIESPKTAPAAIIYRHETRGRIAHPWTIPGSFWRVELARFAVPHNQQGILRSIEQYLGFFNLQGLISSIVDPRNPFADIDNSITGIWKFRLERYYNNDNVVWISEENPVNPLPGLPFEDMPETDNIWFPVGSSRFHHILIPGGYILRAFWECHTSTVRPVAALCLSGSVQSIYDEIAHKAVKEW